jgi:phage terminase large subunit-like protein
MPNGGKRPGAGRPKGSKSYPLAPYLPVENGLSPLEFLLAVVSAQEAPLSARMEAAKAALPYCHPKRKAADRAVAVFNRLRLADVPGNPRLADAAGDWFRDIVRALFGSWDDEAAERHIREIFALIGKKNSKTSYGAGLMLTALILNERPRGKFLLVAPTQDVTELAFSQAAGMIALDGFLSKHFRVQEPIQRQVRNQRLTAPDTLLPVSAG